MSVQKMKWVGMPEPAASLNNVTRIGLVKGGRHIAATLARVPFFLRPSLFLPKTSPFNIGLNYHLNKGTCTSDLAE